MVVAATSGISAVIAPDSTVVQRLDEGEEGWLVQEVPLRGQLTLAARIGHVVELLLCAVALAAVAVAAVSAWSTRRRRRAIA